MLFSVIISLLAFSILVLIHEYGHFIVAKKSGILVEEFALGMGPILLKKQSGETLYSIRAFPIGGFCKMLGEDEEEISPRAFNSKSSLVRIGVVVMGPIFNLIFAFILIFCLLATSQAVVFPIVTDFVDGSNAESSGLEVGDEVVGIDGQFVGTYQDIFLYMDGNNGESVELEVLKADGTKELVNIEPVLAPDGRMIIGFTHTAKTGILSPEVEGYEKATLFETIKESFFTMIFYVKSVIIGFVRLFTLNLSPQEVAGPIGIVQVMGDSVSDGLEYGISGAIRNLGVITALLSTNLGVINLFPIPAMDGGRLFFLIIEGIRKKPLNRKIEGYIHFVGFVLLMGLMVVIASNDIIKLING